MSILQIRQRYLDSMPRNKKHGGLRTMGTPSEWYRINQTVGEHLDQEEQLQSTGLKKGHRSQERQN